MFDSVSKIVTLKAPDEGIRPDMVAALPTPNPRPSDITECPIRYYRLLLHRL